MQTRQLQMIKEIDEVAIEEAADLLREGEVVAFPTETVYGLGADATNPTAVDKIFQAKGRPSDNPLIVHVATEQQLLAIVTEAPTYVEKLIAAFSPGPITYVLKSAGKVADVVTAGLATVGVRIPNHPVALALLQRCALPIAAPSANRSGRPSPTTAEHVRQDLEGKIAAIIDGGATDIGLESTVVDCTGEVPVILRLGEITQAEIANIAGTCDLYEPPPELHTPKSPGLKYKHYAPEVPLILVKDREKLPHIVRENQLARKRIALFYHSDIFHSLAVEKLVLLGNNETMMAKNLYAALRACKRDEVDVIVCEAPITKGGKSALLDRLGRAATEIID